MRSKRALYEETEKRLSRKALEKALYDAGAFYVIEIKADRPPKSGGLIFFGRWDRC